MAFKTGDEVEWQHTHATGSGYAYWVPATVVRVNPKSVRIVADIQGAGEKILNVKPETLRRMEKPENDIITAVDGESHLNWAIRKGYVFQFHGVRILIDDIRRAVFILPQSEQLTSEIIEAYDKRTATVAHRNGNH